MSEGEEQPPNPYSHPTSAGRLLLRTILAVGIVLAIIAGVIWYTSK